MMTSALPSFLRSGTTRFVRAATASLAVLVSVSLTTGSATANDDRYFALGYSVALNGIPLGKGQFSGRMAGGAYRLKGNARLTGLAGALFNYSASGEVDGYLGAQQHSPRNFVSSASDDRATQVVRMSFNRTRVTRLSLRPEAKAGPDRVTVRQKHMRGVVDPMTALMVPVANGTGIHASTCNRTIPIFNGRERFNLTLRYKGIRTVTGSRSNGYSGQVVICQALYQPVAGHRKNRREVDYYASHKGLEVWLAPAGNTGVMVPYKMVLPTPLGTGVIQATAFSASQGRVNRTAATR